MHHSNRQSTKNDMTINIFIVDDHPIILEGLQMIIGKKSDYHVCGCASTIEETFRKITTQKPDVLIADITLKDESGLQVIEKVKQLYPKIKILMITMHDESYFVKKSLQLGAHGYILKSESTRYLLEAIEVILSNNRFLSPNVEKKLFNQMLESDSQNTLTTNIDQLTAREKEVFKLIGQGKSTKDIAEILFVSPRTIDSHKENIKRKLCKHSMNEVLETAIAWIRVTSE